MDYSKVDQIVTICYQFLGIAVIIGGLVWAFIKLYFQQSFVTKKEFNVFMNSAKNEATQHAKETRQAIEEVNKLTTQMDKQFLIFKAEYEGQQKFFEQKLSTLAESNKMQVELLRDMKKELIHKISNISTQQVSGKTMNDFADKMEELVKRLDK